MKPSNNTLCYQGIQRLYRNAIVRQIRLGLTEAYGEDAPQQLRRPFKAAEWERIADDARITRSTGQLASVVRDDFDTLSVNHFFNVYDAHWKALVGSQQSDEVSRKQKQALLGWMKEIKTLRDPLSHPVEEEFSREDGFRLLDCARRVLVQLGLDKEAAALRELSNEVLGVDLEAEADRSLDGQLPPSETIVVGFVGRAKEISQLWDWFDEPTKSRWALAGDGGKGKTAIAFAFARQVQLAAPAPFQTVLWLSAKRQRFVEGTTTSISEPDFGDLSSALSRLLVEMGWEEDAHLPLESKTAQVLTLLREFPSLVVVDDIDSLESGDEDVIEFFSLKVPATRSKVLFTSRRTIFGMGKSTTLVAGLEGKDAELFVKNRCRLMGLDPEAYTKDVTQRIVAATDGSPLFIEDLLRLSSSAKSPQAALDMWEGKHGHEARRYALRRECELLSSGARDVLMAACTASGSVTVSELASIVGLKEEEVPPALQELQKLFLVPKPTFVEGEQRFSVNQNTRSLVRDVYGDSEQWRRLGNAYQAITRGLPAGGRTRIGAIIRQCGVLSRSGQHTQAEKVMKSALSLHPSNPDLIGFLGRIYKAWVPPRIADAREQFARGAQLKCTRIEMYDHWARMEMKEREWTRAAEAAEAGLVTIPGSGQLLSLAGRARSRLAKELMGGLHHDKALRESTQARSHLEAALKTVPRSEASSRSVVFRALVLLCKTRGDTRGADRFLQRWRRELPDDEWAQQEEQRLASR